MTQQTETKWAWCRTHGIDTHSGYHGIMCDDKGNFHKPEDGCVLEPWTPRPHNQADDTFYVQTHSTSGLLLKAVVNETEDLTSIAIVSASNPDQIFYVHAIPKQDLAKTTPQEIIGGMTVPDQVRLGIDQPSVLSRLMEVLGRKLEEIVKPWRRIVREAVSPISPEELTKITEPTTLDTVAKIQSAVIKHDDAVKKYAFLGMLLAYTEDDQVTEIYTGESSIGKSWVVLRTADLFPSEDVDILGYSSPTAFFYETGTWDKERQVNVVDKQRRIVIFLDMPHARLLERLRPLLSHDRKVITYKATNPSERHRRRTMTAELVGYFSTFFLSAELNLDSQERTRAFLLAISDDPDKIVDTIRLYGERDKDRAKFDAQVEADPERQWLKKRIQAVRDLQVRYVKVPFADELANQWIQEHPNLKPRDQRDFPRLLATVKGITLLNAHHRGLDEKRDITATLEDAQEAKRLYAEIATSNELGLSAHTYELLAKVIYPLTRQGEMPTRRDIQGSYFKLKKRSLSQTWLALELENLTSVGLIVEDQTSKPYRYTVTEAAEAIVEKQTYVPRVMGNSLSLYPHTPTQVTHSSQNISLDTKPSEGAPAGATEPSKPDLGKVS